MKRSFLLIITITGLILGCSKPNDLGDFDTKKWKEDLNGCKGDRVELIDDLIEVKSKFLGLYQKTIIKSLGQPEDQELYSRSQTFYIYYIDPSPACENSPEDPRILEIRFTSLGIANEVNIK
ncbi:hypothetical protein [Roseivirga sp. E12]|uniref:hypothetical protein n=1 Tax=Roseivirga sp. E12 TaxID=2819237 RepID=UPI001ABCF37C|nr:hypothetical protein [Roseivirga sp. E12]MBO3697072.1 hypothetical protein [Roseivirga sp. E12]